MNIEFIGMACALGLSAMGSAFGSGFAAHAAVGAWKKCYANGKPAPFIMVAFSGAPLTQTIYGFLLMNFIRSAVASGADPALAMFTGIFAGLAIGLSANFQGTLAAASAAYLLGASGEAVGRGLATFTGAGRRFEYKGSYHGADVYDDYAHHPGELHALLEMAKTLPYKRIICAFQPHTYTRTKALFDDFVKELLVPDVVVLAEIFAAREQNTIGISSMDLCRESPGSVYCPTLDKVTAALARIACPGDLILTVGAGDIYKAGEKLLKEKEEA